MGKIFSTILSRLLATHPERAQYQSFQVLMHEKTLHKLIDYKQQISQQRVIPGRYFQDELSEKINDLTELSLDNFTVCLLRTKKPTIYAESSVYGNGYDWNQEELSILGDISVAAPVTIYDNGKHSAPKPHPVPFKGTLFFVPGALLRNDLFEPEVTPDITELVKDGQIDDEAYYRLYERRLLPILINANQRAKYLGKAMVLTIPGIGTGQFAGNYAANNLPLKLYNVLIRLLENYGKLLSNICCIYYDPFYGCRNVMGIKNINGIELQVNPFSYTTHQRSQLCMPDAYDKRFKDCTLGSVVSWDPVSWPGNDYYLGHRRTDDGVKSAATNAMTLFTTHKGTYQKDRYIPCGWPEKTVWQEIIDHYHLRFDVSKKIFVLHNDQIIPLHEMLGPMESPAHQIRATF